MAWQDLLPPAVLEQFPDEIAAFEQLITDGFQTREQAEANMRRLIELADATDAGEISLAQGEALVDEFTCAVFGIDGKVVQ
jgi:hypothetical protein